MNLQAPFSSSGLPFSSWSFSLLNSGPKHCDWLLNPRILNPIRYDGAPTGYIQLNIQPPRYIYYSCPGTCVLPWTGL
ncbi:hypothetical protein I7I53_08238 [Histoplasma capsulatum var. duboisii H88]|uniref:Uncharacterized protein n=1 Tax=Ajellomyces capsulatus (strain H88) TaxID=544711 RepID=A0A8A1LI07_AJEC8|nr:hypothetical protein I7I53_08238 [Histoplasma capsulatum var. duboisii H88]